VGIKNDRLRLDQYAMQSMSFPRLDNPSCADPSIDPDFFFPETADEMVETIESIRAICGRCPEQEPCLKFALDNQIVHGIWAGTTPNQRRRLTHGNKKTSMVQARETLYEINASVRYGMSLTKACQDNDISVRTYQRYLQHEKTGWKHWSAGKNQHSNKQAGGTK
jgi:WhiB family redox-sensing transcriptional regulator